MTRAGLCLWFVLFGCGGDSGSFQLSTRERDVPLAIGGTATVTLEVTAAGGFARDIMVTALGLPPGVTAEALTIPAGATTGMLTLHSTAGVTRGEKSIDLEGAAEGLSPQRTRFMLAVGITSGLLDPTFGAGGVASFSVGTTSRPHNLVLLPDGKILLVGEQHRGTGVALVFHTTLARLNADGSSTRGSGAAD